MFVASSPMIAHVSRSRSIFRHCTTRAWAFNISCLKSVISTIILRRSYFWRMLNYISFNWIWEKSMMCGFNFWWFSYNLVLTPEMIPIDANNSSISIVLMLVENILTLMKILISDDSWFFSDLTSRTESFIQKFQNANHICAH